ncbi:MAG: DUF2748 family protein [Rickettsiales bacterium]|nr:DUF2748 family protein [Rickettsiales bacterium]
MPIPINNHYDRLAIMPMLEKDELYIELENLAQKIVKKGLLRISADNKCNFIILPLAGGEEFLSFSKRELSDEKLLQKTYKTLKEKQIFYELDDELESPENKVQILKRKLSKYEDVLEDEEIKIARLLVQAAHPAIIENMIYEEVKFFVSYSHSVSELLNVQLWQSARYSSGLQANDFRDSSVFVSCGGNPFFDAKESDNENDGKNAIAKLLIIAAQELAHNADLIKNEYGQNIGRASTNPYMNAPNARCEEARQKDIERLKKIINKLENIGLKRVYDNERKYRIQLKYRKFAILTHFLFLRKIISQIIFLISARLIGLNFVSKIKKKSMIAEECIIILGDMLFNLEPQALAYKNSNKNIEKAIMCAEALARVPQQEIKWGRAFVRYLTPNMYKYFYTELLTEELRTYKRYFGKKYIHKLTKPKPNFVKRILR